MGQQPLFQLLSGLRAALQTVLTQKSGGDNAHLQILLCMADSLLFHRLPTSALQVVPESIRVQSRFRSK